MDSLSNLDLSHRPSAKIIITMWIWITPTSKCSFGQLYFQRMVAKAFNIIKCIPFVRDMTICLVLGCLIHIIMSLILALFL